MLEIVLLLTALAVTLLAHKGYGKRKYHRNYKLRRVRLATTSALGALGAGAVVANNIVNAAADTYRLISVDCSYSWSGKQEVDDAATFGLAHGDYTAAEIEESLEAITAIDLGDKVAQEQANRLVREIGTFAGSTAGVANAGAIFNDGRRMKVRLNWAMSIGQQVTLWIRNSSGVVYTTGSVITMNGDLWIKDAA